MKALALVVLASFALAACSNERDGENADDFAARVGGAESPAAGGTASVAEATPVDTPPPAGVDVTALEQLGDISMVDLGRRDGGCAFQANGTEMLLAGAPADPGAAGKAVVRLGGKLYLLDMASGGMPAVRGGAAFAGPGMTVTVAPVAGDGARRDASVTVASGAGGSKVYTGQWICA